LHAKNSSIFVLVWPQASVTEFDCKQADRTGFYSAPAMIARLHAELIDAAVNR
jgi:hypothetical protein